MILDTVNFEPALWQGQWYNATNAGGTTVHAWDVTAANQLFAMAAPGLLDQLRRGVTPDAMRFGFFPIDGANGETLANSGVEVDPAYWPTTDPRRPVIAIPEAGKFWIIDGWHRIAHARHLGWDLLPTFILTPEEDRACRICNCCRVGDPVKVVVARTKNRPSLLGPGGALVRPAFCDQCGAAVWEDPFCEAPYRDLERRPDVRLEFFCIECVAIEAAKGAPVFDSAGKAVTL